MRMGAGRLENSDMFSFSFVLLAHPKYLELGPVLQLAESIICWGWDSHSVEEHLLGIQ